MRIFVKLVFVAVGILILWGLIDLINAYIIVPKEKNKIKQNLSVCNGAKIKKIGFINKVSGAVTFDYYFSLDNNYYHNKVVINLSFKSNSSHYLMNKSFPVAYEKNNPENSFILITPEVFRYFQIPFPDSLSWINEDVIE